MKKRLFILILGIVMFIPIVQAKDITKEELVNNLQKYVDEFNSGDRKYESSYPEISGTMEEMILTINNESINLKNDNVETTIVLNENEQTINVVATDTGSTSINENSTDEDKQNVYKKTMYRSVQFQFIAEAIIESKGIDKELGISPLDVYLLRAGEELNSRTGTNDWTIYLDRIKIEEEYDYLIPSLTVEKISDTKIRVYPHIDIIEDATIVWENVWIDLLIYEDSSSNATSMTYNVAKDGYTDIDIDPTKEYMIKGVVANTLQGYTRLSEPVYFERQLQQDSQATDNNETNIQKTTSNTTENPKTGIKNYTIVGFIAILVLALTYKLYKNRINN